MDVTIILIILCIGLAVLFCLCLAVANFAPEKFYMVFKQVDDIPISTMSISEFLSEVNTQEFQGKLRVHQIGQIAGDAYVRGGDLLLSTNTLGKNGLASFTILAHELGHAMQDRDGNSLLVKSILVRIGMVIGPLMFPSLIIGIVLFAIGGNLFYWGIGLLVFGALIFLLAVILKIITIGIEGNASKRAIKLLKDRLDKKDLKEAKRLLSSAKLTYWAQLFRTLFIWKFFTKKRAELF